MVPFDQHLHSRHSMDSRAEPRENVLQAIERGLAGLTFTEHFDTHPEDWSLCTYDDDAYRATIASLREEFGERIFVGKGIEVCYQPQNEATLLDFLQRHTFDLVILSVHYFAPGAIHKREFWTGLDAMTGTRMYLEHVREAVRWCRRLRHSHGHVFDVLGHLDLVKRYTQRFYGTYDVSPFGNLIDEILENCLEAELIPEINTSSLRQGLQETMPGPATVRRSAELGGKAVSVGSDAHRSEDIGAGFEAAAEMMRDAGLKFAMFRSRSCSSVAVAE